MGRGSPPFLTKNQQHESAAGAYSILGFWESGLQAWKGLEVRNSRFRIKGLDVRGCMLHLQEFRVPDPG